MKVKWLIAASAMALVMQTPWSAQAYECPKHFAAAQAAIDKVAADMQADIPMFQNDLAGTATDSCCGQIIVDRCPQTAVVIGKVHVTQS